MYVYYVYIYICISYTNKIIWYTNNRYVYIYNFICYTYKLNMLEMCMRMHIWYLYVRMYDTYVASSNCIKLLVQLKLPLLPLLPWFSCALKIIFGAKISEHLCTTRHIYVGAVSNLIHYTIYYNIIPLLYWIYYWIYPIINIHNHGMII